MSIELEVLRFPKSIVLKDNSQAELRPLKKDDEKEFHQFFLDVPAEERMFIKHRVTEPQVIRDWCENIDLGRNFPLLAVVDQKIVGCATLHQQLGGWKRHVGRVSGTGASKISRARSGAGNGDGNYPHLPQRRLGAN